MLYIMRHGQTDWNIGNQIQGTSDVELNNAGLIQANEAAEYLKNGNFGIKRIVSSDLKRTAQTAQIIGNKLHILVDYDTRLREYNFGHLEGRAVSTISESTLHEFMKNPKAFDAEPFEDAFARVSSFLADADYNTNTLVMSHGIIMRIVIHYLDDGHTFDLRKFMELFHTTRIKNTSMLGISGLNSRIEYVR